MTSITTIAVRWAIDVHVYNSEYRLRNQYNALTELKDAAIAFDAAVTKHPKLCAALNQKVAENLGDANITPLTERTCFAILNFFNAYCSEAAWIGSSVTSLISTFDDHNLKETGQSHAYWLNAVTRQDFTNQQAMMMWTLISYCASVCSIGYTTAYIKDTLDRVSGKDSIHKVNQLEQELGVKSTDVNAIAKLTANLKDCNDILNSVADLDLPKLMGKLEKHTGDLESVNQLSNTTLTQPTEYKSNDEYVWAKVGMTPCYVPEEIVVTDKQKTLNLSKNVINIINNMKNVVGEQNQKSTASDKFIKQKTINKQNSGNISQMF
jgi:hypothetical protein